MRILLHSDELGDNACYALQSGMKHMLLQMSYYADFYTTPAKGVARVGFREFPFVTYHPFSRPPETETNTGHCLIRPQMKWGA